MEAQTEDPAPERQVRFDDEVGVKPDFASRLMVSSGAVVENMERKVDELSDQMKNLTLMLRQSRDEERRKKARNNQGGNRGLRGSNQERDRERGCSFRETPGCYT